MLADFDLAAIGVEVVVGPVEHLEAAQIGVAAADDTVFDLPDIAVDGVGRAGGAALGVPHR